MRDIPVEARGIDGAVGFIEGKERLTFPTAAGAVAQRTECPDVLEAVERFGGLG